jgi:hypothetical protein
MAYRQHVRVIVEISPLTQRIKFFTDNPFVESMVIDGSNFRSVSEVEAILKYYIRFIQMKYLNLEVDVSLPNIYGMFHQSLRPNWQWQQQQQTVVSGGQLVGQIVVTEPVPPQKPEVKFEVNMMEALVGWKSWNESTENLLTTNSGLCVWLPDVAMKAKCRHGGNHPKEEAVFDDCTCGFYASDKKEGARGYGQVLGQVYGWGRYVRGSEGWRSENAYPKMFLLKEEQVDLVERLRQYHVPIFVDQPMKLYSPEEDGYDEYRNTETNRDRGTVEGSSPEED